MSDAKSIVVKVIPSDVARDTVRRLHYSGKVCQNSTLHFGVYWAGKLEGAMQFGSPLDKRKVLPLVHGTAWNQMLELNRMAFSDVLPRNSESRAMGFVFRMLRKHRPDIKWVLSFSDATQCGDGVIYRAAGFCLTGIKKNTDLVRLPDGTSIHSMTLKSSPNQPRRELGGKSFNDITKGKVDFGAYCRAANAKVLVGYQFRYLKFLDPEWESRLAVPKIPFDKIPEAARMYLGKPRAGLEKALEYPSGEEGADPIPALHFPDICT